MKRIIWLTICLLMTGFAFAQTQQGYVKTKGRLNSNGMVIAGTGISGAIVQVKGRSAVLSQANGTFSFPVSTPYFYIQNVSKNGFILIDPDVLLGQHTCSTSPLVLVMEDKKQQEVDLREAKAKTRNNIYKQYLKENEYLREQLEQNKIKQEEYDRLKQRLDDLQDNNEKLIKEMSEYYAKIDYDQLDDFYIQINQLILNGELTKADSILKSKGDLITDIFAFKTFQNLNTQKRYQQAIRDSIEKRQLEELAKRCYSQFEVFKAMHNNDSARAYIELRADLDTTNVYWQLDAGDFINEYIIVTFDSDCLYKDQIKKAPMLKYYNRACNEAKKLCGENSAVLATCYNKLGQLHFSYFQEEEAADYFSKALDITRSLYGENSEEVARCYLMKGESYSDPFAPHGVYNVIAFESYEKAIAIITRIYGDNSLEAAECYAGMGLVCGRDDITASSYYQKALDIYKSEYGEDCPEVGWVYYNYGRTYLVQADYSSRVGAQAQIVAESQFKKSLNYMDPIFYNEQIQYLTVALSYFEKALPIICSTYGDSYPFAIDLFLDIEGIKEEIIAIEQYKEDAEKEYDSLEVPDESK